MARERKKEGKEGIGRENSAARDKSVGVEDRRERGWRGVEGSYRISLDAHRRLVNAFCFGWSCPLLARIFLLGLSASQPARVDGTSAVFSFCKEGVVLDYHLDCSRALHRRCTPRSLRQTYFANLRPNDQNASDARASPL